MHQGGSPERIRLGSLIAIRETKMGGFSLAEMLVVMLIMSFLVLGVPAVHFKKTELKTKQSLHGRFECYYNGSTLMSNYINEEGVREVATVGAATGCTFKPPKNAVYLLVHAVGGGGGASNYTGGKTVTPKTESNTYSTANDFPQWIRDVQGFGKLPVPTTTPPSYTAKRQGNYAIIRYGNAGQPGKTQSIFFPKLTNVEITMKPGKGGALGQPGEKTVVKFNGADVDILEAEGGAAGSGSGQYPMWLDGIGSICQVKELEGRKQNLSDFTSSMEMDKDTEIPSMIDIQTGSGGGGSYGNIKTNYSVTYTIRAGGTESDVKNVSNYVNKITCDNPSECDDGSTSDTCAAQSGKNGAVVILW